MKATLEFDLSDTYQQYLHKQVMASQDLTSIIWVLREEMIRVMNHGEEAESKEAEHWINRLNDMLDDHGVHLESMVR